MGNLCSFHRRGCGACSGCQLGDSWLFKHDRAQVQWHGSAGALCWLVPWFRGRLVYLTVEETWNWHVASASHINVSFYLPAHSYFGSLVGKKWKQFPPPEQAHVELLWAWRQIGFGWPGHWCIGQGVCVQGGDGWAWPWGHAGCRCLEKVTRSGTRARGLCSRAVYPSSSLLLMYILSTLLHFLLMYRILL